MDAQGLKSGNIYQFFVNFVGKIHNFFFFILRVQICYKRLLSAFIVSPVWVVGGRDQIEEESCLVLACLFSSPLGHHCWRGCLEDLIFFLLDLHCCLLFLAVSCSFKQPVGTCPLLSFILKITRVHLCSSILAKISWRRYFCGWHPRSFVGITVGNEAELHIQWCFPDQFWIKWWSTFDI